MIDVTIRKPSTEYLEERTGQLPKCPEEVKKGEYSIDFQYVQEKSLPECPEEITNKIMQKYIVGLEEVTTDMSYTPS